MKVKEFIEFVGNDKNKMLKPEQLKSVIKKCLNTKDYIGIKGKKQLVENIVDECILYEDGIFKFDDMDKYIVFTMKTIEAYTDIELSDDIESDYDVLCSSRALELVIDTFKKEYDDVNVLLSMKCDYVLSGNSLEAQVGKFLSNLSDKIDLLSVFLSKQLGDFNLDDLQINKESMLKLMDFVEAQK